MYTGKTKLWIFDIQIDKNKILWLVFFLRVFNIIIVRKLACRILKSGVFSFPQDSRMAFYLVPLPPTLTLLYSDFPCAACIIKRNYLNLWSVEQGVFPFLNTHIVIQVMFNIRANFVVLCALATFSSHIQ